MPMAIPHIDEFCVAGISHWKASVAVRERFSFSNERKEALLEDAKQKGLTDVVIISTCNRSEIFARINTKEDIEQLLIEYSSGSREEYEKYGFLYEGKEAIRHLLRVAVGLDAQVLGDLQIIKQVKDAYEQACKNGMVNAVMHRLMHFVFRTHKRIKTETELSGGAATTAYAAVQFARKKCQSLHDKRILLVGTGKIGKITCKNLISQGAKDVTLLNRDPERAKKLGKKFLFPSAGLEQLGAQLQKADIVLVSTSAEKPIITKEHLPLEERLKKHLLMIDLSVPRNIDPELSAHPDLSLMNMDSLNDATCEAFKRRKKNIPKAQAIIEEEIDGFSEWLSEQKVVPAIRALNKKLHEIRREEIKLFRAKFPDSTHPDVDHLTRRIVNKIMAHPIGHLKEHHQAPDDITRVLFSMFKLKNGTDLD